MFPIGLRAVWGCSPCCPYPPLSCIPLVKGVFSLSCLKRPKQMIVRRWHSRVEVPHLSRNTKLAFSEAVSYSFWNPSFWLVWYLETEVLRKGMLHKHCRMQLVRVSHQNRDGLFCSSASFFDSCIVLDESLWSFRSPCSLSNIVSSWGDSFHRIKEECLWQLWSQPA